MSRSTREPLSETSWLRFDHVAIATGSRWRDDGVGRRLLRPLPREEGAVVAGADDLIGVSVPGQTVTSTTMIIIMGGVLAELLCARASR